MAGGMLVGTVGKGKGPGGGDTQSYSSVSAFSNQTQRQKKSASADDIRKRNSGQLINLGRGNVAFRDVWGHGLSSCEKFSASTKRSRADIPGIATDPLNLPSEDEGKQLCKAPFAFEEQENPARENDYRVFVEGVEVSGYVRSSLVWTIESTGGMNSCRFTLNNNQDAFIISPLNVCSNLSLNGWRVDSANVYSPYQHSEARYDELAKYLIYKRKFERVAPGTSRADIDLETGMWYYPLPPMGLIFNRHDTVRVFRKLSHIDAARIYPAVGNKGEMRSFDLWAPAFAGFIRSASYTDDYVGGDRSVSIECYDFRGLLEGMRVRTVGLRLGTPNPGSKAVAKTVAEKSLGSALAGAKAHGLADLLNLLLNRYTKICEYNSAAKTSDIGALRLIMPSCAGEAVTRTKGLTASVVAHEKSFANNAAKLKQLNNDIADFPLTDATTKPTLTFRKGSATDPSALADSTQKGQSTAPAGGTPSGATPKTNGTITAPSLSPEVIASLTSDSAPSSSTQNPGQAYVTPALNASGDVEIMQAVSTYLSNPDLVIALYPPGGFNAGDATCVPYLKERDKAKLSEFAKTCATCTAPAAVKTNCIEDVMKAYATKLNKSVVVYAFSELSVAGVGYVRKYGGMAKEGFDPPMVTGDKKYGSLEIGINTAVVKNALTKATLEIASAVKPVRAALEKDADALWKDMQDINKALDAAEKEERKAADKAVGAASNRLAELNRIQQDILDAAQKKADAAGIPNAGNIAELVTVDPTFEGRMAGIFSDLIKKVGQGSHPLEGMSFEVALTWLCCAPTGGPGCRPGMILPLTSYGEEAKLQEWNKLVVFGMAKRPLTFDEVTAIGKASGSDMLNNSPDIFSPYRPLLHLMLPATGTGARTIVQQDMTANTGNSTSLQYETRNSLINRISSMINYQIFVSPWGDIIAEFPHYDSIPKDWGKSFEGAYTLDKEITGLTVNEESSDLYTAWVITGMENTKEAQKLVAGQTSSNIFSKISIISPILARRLGVRVEHISLELPGVGAQISDASPAGGQEALLVWGLLHIQKQLGEAHKVTINEFPDRPYLVPNRPMYVVPRQKYCMIRSVTYTMDKPNGNATVGLECNNTRWLYRDGTFRQICGGEHQIINYTGLFTGQLTVSVKAGPGSSKKKKSAGQAAQESQNKEDTAWGCAPHLGERARAAQSFYGQEIAGQDGAWQPYSGNTSGAGGMPGFIPPSNALGQGKYGTAVAHAHGPANPGTKSANNSPAKAGLLVEGQKREGKPSAYNLKTLFIDPYPFGIPVFEGQGTRTHDVIGIHAFGLIRMYHKQTGSMGYANKAKGGDLELDWHPGVDIMGHERWQLRAPFDMIKMVATLQVGPATGQDRNLEWVTVTRLDDPVASKVAVLKDGKVQIDVSKGLKMLVYSAQYKMYKKFVAEVLNNSGGNLALRISRGSHKSAGSGGISLTCYGYVIPPKGGGSQFEGKRLYAKLTYRHCLEIKTNANGEYYGVNTNSASAGDIIALMGNTGNSANPHAHIELYVRNPTLSAEQNGPMDEQKLFSEVQKANDEFLTTQLLLKVTGGHPQEDQLSKEWKAYFRGKSGITTPAEAVTYLLAHKPKEMIETERSDDTGFLATNPFFFYEPQEYVPAIAASLNKLAAAQPQWNTQAYMDTIQVNTASVSPVCGKLAPQYVAGVQASFNKCMLVAKQKATSSYSSYATAERQCKSSLVKEVAAVKKEGAKAQNQEDMAQKAAAAQKQKQASAGTSGGSGRKV